MGAKTLDWLTSCRFWGRRFTLHLWPSVSVPVKWGLWIRRPQSPLPALWHRDDVPGSQRFMHHPWWLLKKATSGPGSWQRLHPDLKECTVIREMCMSMARQTRTFRELRRARNKGWTGTRQKKWFWGCQQGWTSWDRNTALRETAQTTAISLPEAAWGRP